MRILHNSLDLLFSELFFELRDYVSAARVVLKLEGYNVTGSIKIKSALFMVCDLERRGVLQPGRSTIVESSSGNLGVALALICRMRGYRFLCVTDPNTSVVNRRAIEAYGGEVLCVDQPDPHGGFLQTRLAMIATLLAEHTDYVWLNQYANRANARAHADWTAREILDAVGRVTHLYVGTGTTGTAMGLAERFAVDSPHTEITAVEPEGSVTFDSARKGRRRIPGIGTSRRPELADSSRLHRVVYVAELDTIRACHRVVRRYGMLAGGSTGTALAAIRADAARFRDGDVIVAIAPDAGEKYLDTIYSPEWLRENFGDAAVLPPDPTDDRVAVDEPLEVVVARHTRAVAGAAYDVTP